MNKRELEVIAAQKKARDQRQEDERARHEKAQAEWRTTMDLLEHRIAPLKLSKVVGREDDPNWGYLNRKVKSESGEDLGYIVYRNTGYSWKSKMKFTLSSPRIPTRGRYSYGDGSRIYQKLDSAVAGIKKFCIPVSADETRAETLRKELTRYREVLNRSYRRSLTTDGDRYGSSPQVNGFINLLASDIKQDQIEGAEYIRILVRKKRAHNRFDQWVKETFIEPRQAELDSLDLSKEKVR